MGMRNSRWVILCLVAATVSAGTAAIVRSETAHAASAAVVRHGIKPIRAIHRAAPLATANLTLHSATLNGAVSPQPKVYLVFWGSQWSSDAAGAAPALQNFFQALYGPTDTWGLVQSQYCGGMPVGTQICGAGGTHIVHPNSSLLAGVWFDNGAAAPTTASANQIAAEANTAAAHFGNTTQASNLNTQYVIASGHGTHPDGFPNSGFCAWHSSVGGANGTIAYTNLPYIPDNGAGSCTTIGSPTLLDGYFSTETHEFAETVTDLWPNNGWLDASGNENGDLCVDLDSRLILSTGTFDVQGVWSNIKGACVTSQTENVPGAPTATFATAGTGSAQVAFTAPASNGGSPILQYQVTSSPGNIVASGSASPITVNGLANGQPYTFTVTALNTVGTSAPSTASNTVTPGGTTRTVSVSWSPTESARLNQMAPSLGTNGAGVQKTSVYVISYLVGLISTTPTPVTIAAPGSAVTYVDTWQSAEFSVLDRVKTKFVLNDADATRFSTYLVDFLLALGGH